MKLKKATKEDSFELIRLIQLADDRTEEAASKKVNKVMRSKDSFFIIVIENEKILGYLLFITTELDENAQRFVGIERYSCVAWIAIHPDFRDKHLGSRLLKEAEKYALKDDKDGLWLDCREEVVDFYKKNGFEVKGVYKKESSSKILKDCFVMTKEIIS